MLITDNPDRGRDGETPTRWRAVAAPPAGTEILSVLNQDGGLAVDPDTRDLQIEVAPAGSDILRESSLSAGAGRTRARRAAAHTENLRGA